MTDATNETRLLLVDDETDFLEAMQPGLERRGFLVTTAESGQAALQLLSDQTFDVVILDVRMPGIDGVDTFLEIKRLAPNLPVIILTGHGNIDQAFETSREGVYDYLTKPCDVSKLASVARQALEQRRPIHEASGTTDAEINLLLVDDDRDLLEAMTPPLERRGLNVHVAHNGRDAMRIAGEHEIHVAVIDVVMPDVGGIMLLRQLRKTNPLLEVIVLTGHPSAEDARHGLKDGAFDFLTKPQPVDHLLRKIRAAFEHRQQKLDNARAAEVDEILSKRPD
jgi:DNA-binding NtrC family response regulator